MIDLKKICHAWLQKTHTHTQEKRKKDKTGLDGQTPMTVYRCNEKDKDCSPKITNVSSVLETEAVQNTGGH